MYCYCIKNIINNKKYIGITKKIPKKRFKEHIDNARWNKHSNIVFHKAIRKYGEENFEIEWEKNYNYQCDWKELGEVEKYYIKKYNTFINLKDNHGYNMTLGGDGGIIYNSRKIKQYTKELKFIKSFEKIRDASEELNINESSINASCNNRISSAGGFIWCYYEDDPVIFNNREKEVVQYDLKGNILNFFESASEAERKTNINNSSIIQCCLKTKRYRSAGGFLWTYAGDTPNKFKNSKFKKVAQVNILDGTIINSFESIIEASRRTGASRKSISKCCLRKQELTMGKRFRYLEEVLK